VPSAANVTKEENSYLFEKDIVFSTKLNPAWLIAGGAVVGRLLIL